MAKRVPDSRTPRRLTNASTTTTTMLTSTECRATSGKADAMLDTPDVTDTATVMT